MGQLHGDTPQCPAARGHTWAGLKDAGGCTGQVEFGLWSVQGAAMPDFKLEMCCCPAAPFLQDGRVGCHSVLPVGNMLCLNS